MSTVFEEYLTSNHQHIIRGRARQPNRSVQDPHPATANPRKRAVRDPTQQKHALAELVAAMSGLAKLENLRKSFT
jgi:hypothetical protein